MFARVGAMIVACLVVAVPATAYDETPIDDPEQRALYENLIDEVRCLVCQNQTIGDSNAPLASDLRREIREQVEDGRSESEIKAFLTDRYGDFVLYRPRYGGPALLLWAAPVVLLLFGIVMLFRSLKRRAALPAATEADEAS